MNRPKLNRNWQTRRALTMANLENSNAGDVSFPEWHPAVEDVAALLDLLEDPPLDEAEERLICAFKARLGGGNVSAPRSRSRCPRRNRPLPDQHFRPSLEDLGPREMSSFPFSIQGLGASIPGAASMAILAAQHTVVLPSAGPDSSSLTGCGHVDTRALDKYFSTCRANPDEIPSLLPELGAILMLGGLRQDQDHCPLPGPARNRRSSASQLVA